MRGFAGRIFRRRGDDPLDDLRIERFTARRAGLVAQQPVDAFPHEALLPAPHDGLGAPGAAHNCAGAQAVGRQQKNFRPPDVLLRAVPVGHTARSRARSEAVTVTMIPLRMPQTRTPRASRESSMGLGRQIVCTSGVAVPSGKKRPPSFGKAGAATSGKRAPQRSWIETARTRGQSPASF